ncbi:MAG: heavy-metal-associated domain-containing protein, partial [Candidatus Limnocylindria bacterium]
PDPVGSAVPRTEAAAASPGQATARYVVPTITCPSCAARIRASAGKEPGVIDVAVDLDTQRVTVTYDPAKTDPEKIAAAIRKGGDTVLPGD